MMLGGSALGSTALGGITGTPTASFTGTIDATGQAGSADSTGLRLFLAARGSGGRKRNAKELEELKPKRRRKRSDQTFFGGGIRATGKPGTALLTGTQRRYFNSRFETTGNKAITTSSGMMDLEPLDEEDLLALL